MSAAIRKPATSLIARSRRLRRNQSERAGEATRHARRGERRRRHAAGALVRTFLVVMDAPLLDDPPGLLEAREPIEVQAFDPEPAVGLSMNGFRVDFLSPLRKVFHDYRVAGSFAHMSGLSMQLIFVMSRYAAAP